MIYTYRVKYVCACMGRLISSLSCAGVAFDAKSGTEGEQQAGQTRCCVHS